MLPDRRLPRADPVTPAAIAGVVAECLVDAYEIVVHHMKRNGGGVVLYLAAKRVRQVGESGGACPFRMGKFARSM
jgi:hypothetical protein